MQSIRVSLSFPANDGGRRVGSETSGIRERKGEGPLVARLLFDIVPTDREPTHGANGHLLVIKEFSALWA